MFCRASTTYCSTTPGAIQFRTDPDGTRFIWDPINDHDAVTETEAVKAFSYSQIEARFGKLFRFGIGQMIMIGGKAPSLTEVLPNIFWHDASGFGNVMLGLSAAAVPLPGLEVFGEFSLDDFRGADEGPEGKPAQYGWQTGARYVLNPWQDLLLTLGGEYTFTNEWMYCRWQPYLTMYQRHLINPSRALTGPWASSMAPTPATWASTPRPALRAARAWNYPGNSWKRVPSTSACPIPPATRSTTIMTSAPTSPPQTTTLAAIRAQPDQISNGISLQGGLSPALGLRRLPAAAVLASRELPEHRGEC